MNYVQSEGLEEQLLKIFNNISNMDNCLAKNACDNLVKDIQAMPQNGESLSDLCDELIEKIIPYCANFHNPNFMGFPDSGNSPSGIVGAVTAQLLQQNLINSTFCAPIATIVEIGVIKWFRALIGYNVEANINSVDDVGGIITNSGTMSNAVAMLLARLNKFPNSYIEGVNSSYEMFGVVPRSISHYSIGSSLCWTGCGNHIIEVETKNFRYDLEALEKVLRENKGKVMVVVVYAGDSRTMTIDNIKQVYKLVKSIDSSIWIHVDACNGFCLMFSEKLKNKLDGIELCDSIAMDPHKMLSLPYTASMLLVKDPVQLARLKTQSDLIMNDDFSFGQITPFIGSKEWMSLKIWCVLKHYGLDGLNDIINRRYELSQYFKRAVENNPKLKLINNVDAFSVVFVYIKNSQENQDENNEINKKIYNRIMTEKKYYLHQFPLDVDGKKVYVLRFFSANMLLDKENIDQLLDYVCKIGESI